jgi:hypothetical protein
VIFISAFVFLVLAQIVFRRRSLAVAVLFLGMLALMMGGSTAFAPSIVWLTGAMTMFLVVFSLVRFGLLAYVVLLIALQILAVSPPTFNVSAWYAPVGMVGPLVVVIIAVYGFWVSLAGRPLFRDDLLKP